MDTDLEDTKYDITTERTNHFKIKDIKATDYYFTFSGKIYHLNISKKRNRPFEDIISEIQKYYQLETCEVELMKNGRLISSFPVEESEVHVSVLLKHIMNFDWGRYPIRNFTKDFFSQRNINVSELFNLAFDACLQEIKCEDFELNSMLMKEFKQYTRLAYQMTSSIGSLIEMVLRIALLEYKGIREREGIISFSLGLKHGVICDHTITEEFSRRTLLFVHDYVQKDDLENAIFECLNKLRAYTFSSEFRDSHFVFGIATNFDNWSFCCYHPPVAPEIPVSSHNFYISKPFVLMEDHCGMFNEEFFKEVDNIESKFSVLIRMIIGLLQPEVDIYFANRYFQNY